MANKTCRPLDEEGKEFEEILCCLKNGYTTKDGVKRRGNQFIAFSFFLEGTIGLRVSDCVRLELQNFEIRNKNEVYLHIKEKKTGKVKNLYIPREIYDTILDFCISNNIGKKEKIVKVGIRAIQKSLQNVANHLDLGDSVGTHSCRKTFCNIAAKKVPLQTVQAIMMHSSIATTRRYISVNSPDIIEAMEINIKKY